MSTQPVPQSNFFAQRAHQFLAALVFRDFRFLAFSTLCSSSGAWALIVARGAWVYGIPELLGTQGLWVGVITFAAMSPRFFATPFIGYLADKMTRKTLLQWVYALQIVQASIMAILVMIGISNPWYVVALAIVNGTLRSTQMTASQSLTPNLVDRDRLPNAVALNQAMQQGSRAVGPAILLAISVTVGSGAIFGSGGVSFSLQNLAVTLGTSAIVFWACAVFYLAALTSALNIRTVSSGVVDRRRSFWANAAAGFAYIYSTPLVFGILMMALAHCVLVMSFESMLPPLALEKLSPDGITFNANDVYALMAALGIGALFSSLFVGGIVNHMTRGKVFLLLGFTSSLTPIGMGLVVPNRDFHDRGDHDGPRNLRLHDHHPHRHPVRGAGRYPRSGSRGLLHAHWREHGLRQLAVRTTGGLLVRRHGHVRGGGGVHTGGCWHGDRQRLLARHLLPGDGSPSGERCQPGRWQRLELGPERLVWEVGLGQ